MLITWLAIWMAAAGLIPATAAAGGGDEPGRSNPSSAQQEASVRVLAVAPTEVSSGGGSLPGAEQGLGDMLAVLMADQPNVRIVERAALERVLREQKLSLSGATDAGGAAQAGKLLKADAIILSTLTQNGDQLCLIAQVVEVNGARISASVQEDAPTGRLLDAVQRAAMRLAAALNMTVDAPDEKELDLAPGISLRLMRGAAFFNDGHPLRAAVEYMRVLAVDPLHEESRIRLAESLLAGGKPRQAARVCDDFLKRSPGSPQADRVRDLRVRCNAASVKNEDAAEPGELGK